MAMAEVQRKQRAATAAAKAGAPPPQVHKFDNQDEARAALRARIDEQRASRTRQGLPVVRQVAEAGRRTYAVGVGSGGLTIGTKRQAEVAKKECKLQVVREHVRQAIRQREQTSGERPGERRGGGGEIGIAHV